MGMTEIMEMVLNIGLQPALLILFAGYFFKRDKDREESLVEEKYRNREEAKTHKDEISRELESARSQFRDKEALLMSENAKREELIRRESDKREQILKEEAEKRENALMSQLNSTSETMKEISRSMDGINRSMDGINRTIEGMLGRMERLEEKMALKG